jgi:copper chaperone NosL
LLPGCGDQDNAGPPEIRYGDSICAHCGMIISDERFATATVVEGERGDTPMIFDDFSCQLDYESGHPDLAIVTRWSHDHASSQWIPTADLWFVSAEGLITPMASHTAAFSTESNAKAFAEPINGQVMTFEELWNDQAPLPAP